MVNQQVLAEYWDEVRTRLTQKWEQLSLKDLPTLPDNLDQLIGQIQQKTGETRDAVEAYLARLTEEGAEVMAGVRQNVKQGAAQRGRNGAHGADAVGHGYDEARRTVRRRPTQSVAAAFGLGLICGVGLAVLLRGSSRPAPSAMERGRAATEQFGRKLRNSLSRNCRG